MIIHKALNQKSAKICILKSIGFLKITLRMTHIHIHKNIKIEGRQFSRQLSHTTFIHEPLFQEKLEELL